MSSLFAFERDENVTIPTRFPADQVQYEIRYRKVFRSIFRITVHHTA